MTQWHFLSGHPSALVENLGSSGTWSGPSIVSVVASIVVKIRSMFVLYNDVEYV